MRALVVELGFEAVEAAVLPGEGGGWGARGFLLQRPVHALVPAVLLRVPQFDELGVDAKMNPPDRESAQPSDGRRREGRPVVGTHDRGKAVLLEQPVQHGFAPSCPVERSPWQPRRNRVQPSVTVSG